jgi:hypothetical protein
MLRGKRLPQVYYDTEPTPPVQKIIETKTFNTN